MLDIKASNDRIHAAKVTASQVGYGILRNLLEPLVTSGQAGALRIKWAGYDSLVSEIEIVGTGKPQSLDTVLTSEQTSLAFNAAELIALNDPAALGPYDSYGEAIFSVTIT